MPALGDRTLDVLEESECGIHGSGVGIAAGRIDRLQQAVLPRQQLLAVRQREPEQGEEHLRRVRHREVGDGVEPALDRRGRRRSPPPARATPVRAAPGGGARRTDRAAGGSARGRADRPRSAPAAGGSPTSRRRASTRTPPDGDRPSSTAAHDVRNTAPSISTTSPASRTVRHPAARSSPTGASARWKGTGRHLPDLPRLARFGDACVLRHLLPRNAASRDFDGFVNSTYLARDDIRRIATAPAGQARARR